MGSSSRYSSANSKKRTGEHIFASVQDNLVTVLGQPCASEEGSRSRKGTSLLELRLHLCSSHQIYLNLISQGLFIVYGHMKADWKLPGNCNLAQF